MKILICSLQVSSAGAKGHFVPAVEIALQAKKSGHDVTLLPLPSKLGKSDIDLCAKYNIRIISPPEIPSGILKSKEELAELASNNQKTHLAFKSFLVDPLDYQVKDFENIIVREKPDIIINDLLLYLPTIVSNKLSIKNYGYCAGFKLLASEDFTLRYREYYELLAPDINNFFNRIGVKINLKNIECLTEGGNFVFFPPDLDIFKSDNNEVQCIGSLPNTLATSEILALDEIQPYAVLSFGSVLDPFDYAEITQEVIRLCKEKELHLYISTEKVIRDEKITTMPFLPLSKILRNAKLYFHHGGANSFNEATRIGVPQVLIALTTDQPIQEDLMNKLGHGFTLNKDDLKYQDLVNIFREFADAESVVNKRRKEMKGVFSNSNGAISLIQKIEKDFYRDNIYGEKVDQRKIYFPETISSVQEIVEKANIEKEKIYPISSAKSYGMGTKINRNSKSSYLDLKYLKNISNYDERGGTIEIESGVTQKELSDYLLRENSKYTVNVTGSSEDSSIISNIVDRGIGHFNEREKDIISLKVVTGKGGILETGGSVFLDSQVSHLYSSGLGPNFSSLFLQSSFGIVVSAIIKLVPIRDTEVVNMILKDNKCISELIFRLDELIRRGIFTESFHISNKNRKESVLAPLLARKKGISINEAKEQLVIEGEFFITTSIRTDSRLIEPFKRVIENELSDLCEINFSSKAIFETEGNDYLSGVFNHSFGIPCDDAILSLGYEFNKLINPKRLEREGVGTLFLVPLIPFEGSQVKKVIEIVNETFSNYEFIPYITLNSISNKCFEGVVNLNFDNQDPVRAKRAKEVMIKVFMKFNENGFSPERLSVFQKESFVGVKDCHIDAIKTFKKVFDPNNVIVGAKYEF